MATFTAFCQQANGRGTVWIQAVEAETLEDAIPTAINDCAEGYTGTIAEKDTFIMLPAPPDEDFTGRYYHYDPEDPNWQKVDDKWGPAGCFDLGDGWFLFFGWASS